MAPLFEASAPRAERVGFWLYVSHLAVAFSIAASNILLGLTVLSLPRTCRRPVPWAELAPLLIPLGFYVLLLMGSILAYYDPKTSVRGLTEIFALATLAAAQAALDSGAPDAAALYELIAAWQPDASGQRRAAA